MGFIKILMGIIVLVLLATVFVDMILNGNSIYKRWRIGRWESQEEWQKSVIKVASRWIYHAPIVKQTDQTRYLLKDMIQGNYRNQTIQSWQVGGLYLGLSERNPNIENQKLQEDFIDQKTGQWKEKPTEVDYALLAYAIMKSSDNCEAIKPAMDTMYQVITERIQKSDYAVCYRLSIPDVRFVDTIGFICPFLMCYSKKYNCEEARKIAENQIEQYYQKGCLKKSGLMVHSYNEKSEIPLGIYGWGRGTGWWMLGIMDSYLEIPSERLRSLIFTTAEKIKLFENTTGGFSSNLALQNNVDSSITAIAAYFYQKCYEINNEEKQYQKIAQRCVEALMRNTRRSGEIDFSQGDTKGIGIYSQTFDIMPFTQGIATRLVIGE